MRSIEIIEETINDIKYYNEKDILSTPIAIELLYKVAIKLIERVKELENER